MLSSLRQLFCTLAAVLLTVSVAGAQPDLPELPYEDEGPTVEDGIRWAGARTLTEANAFATSPSLVGDENGLHIIYQELHSDQPCSVIYMNSRDKGKTWGNLRNLGKSWAMGKGTTLMSSKGVLHAAWCPSEKGWNGIVYRQSYDGGQSWVDQVRITTTETPIFFPQLRLGDGDYYIAWVEKEIIDENGRRVSPSVLELDSVIMSSEVAMNYLSDNDYDCAIRMKISGDGGKSWSDRIDIEKVFENILTYKFEVDGNTLVFRYRTPKGYWEKRSNDRGLTWSKRLVSEEEFGEVLPPVQTEYEGETLRVGTNKVGASSVIYVKRTDTTPPTTFLNPLASVISSASVAIQWSGEDDWSSLDRLTFSYRVDDGTYSEFLDTRIRTFGPFDDGPHRVAVRARDSADNIDPNPPSVEFTIAVPPETVITDKPKEVTNDQTPHVAWEGSDNTSPPERLVYEYRYNDNNWTQIPLTAVTLPRLFDGEHTFEVRAVDEAGNIDPTPARTGFLVDTSAPTTLSLQIAEHAEGSPILFVKVEGKDNYTDPTNISYSYRVDDGEWSEFDRQVRLPIEQIPDGKHLLAVRAMDRAGNVETVPLSKDFRVAISPQTNIVTTPTGPVPPGEFNIVTEIIDNRGPGDRVYLSYRINDLAWSEYSEGSIVRVDAGGLEDGLHRIEIRAKDAYGHEDTSPATWRFQVDSQQPQAPERLRVAREGVRQVRLSWDGPRREDGEVMGWNIYRSTDPTFGGGEGLETALIERELKERSYVDEPPVTDADVTYYYAVTFVNKQGRESPLSEIHSVIYQKDRTDIIASIQPPQPSTDSFISAPVANILLFVGLAVLLLIVLVSALFVFRRRET